MADSGYYEGIRRGIEGDYAAQMAANTYARTLSQQRGSRELDFMRQSFKRQTPNFTSSFGQRGFGGGQGASGIVRQSMANYLGDFNRQYNEAQLNLTEQLRQHDLTSAQLGSQRTSALADIELERAREIAFTAQNIEAMRSIFGGL